MFSTAFLFFRIIKFSKIQGKLFESHLLSRKVDLLSPPNKNGTLMCSFLNWRRGRDLNPRRAFTLTAFRVRRLQPLSHLSKHIRFHSNLSSFGTVASWLPLSLCSWKKLKQFNFFPLSHLSNNCDGNIFCLFLKKCYITSCILALSSNG